MNRWKQLVLKHLEDQRAAGWADGTLQRTARWMKKFLLWCNEQGLETPAQVTADHVALFHQYLHCTPTSRSKYYTLHTIQQAMTVVRQFFYWATKRGSLLLNPAQDLTLPRVDTRPPQFTVAEVEKLFLIAESLGTPAALRDRAVLETFYRGGLRRRECLQLTMTDVDLAQRTLRAVSPDGHERMVPINEKLAETLQRYLSDSRPHLVKEEASAFFLNTNGKPYRNELLAQMTQRVSRRAGFHISPHHLRHTCALHMLETGVDIHEVGKFLGHRHLTTTAHAYNDMATAMLSRKKRAAQWQRPLTHFSSLVDGQSEIWSTIIDANA